MNFLAFVLLALAMVAAVVDWIAVADKDTRLEYLCKPLVIVLLIGVALAVDAESEAVRAWFIAALAFSLAGDVFLMLKGHDLFIAGLASFFIAHVAYIFGFLVSGVGLGRLLAGVFVAGVSVVLVGNRILKGAREKEPAMAVPVFAYMGVISLMLVVAIGSGTAAALLGALLFYASDALIGWGRFVKLYSWQPLAIIVTYHLAQAALVMALI